MGCKPAAKQLCALRTTRRAARGWRRHARWLLCPIPLATALWLAVIAFGRWQRALVYARVAPAYLPADVVEDWRRSIDWRTPLVGAGVAALVFVVLVVLTRPGRTPRSGNQ